MRLSMACAPVLGVAHGTCISSRGYPSHALLFIHGGLLMEGCSWHALLFMTGLLMARVYLHEVIHGMRSCSWGCSWHVYLFTRLSMACAPVHDGVAHGRLLMEGCSWHALLFMGVAHGMRSCSWGLLMACAPVHDGVAHGTCISS